MLSASSAESPMSWEKDKSGPMFTYKGRSGSHTFLTTPPNFLNQEANT